MVVTEPKSPAIENQLVHQLQEEQVLQRKVREQFGGFVPGGE
jgi:hypothetical protein